MQNEFANLQNGVRIEKEDERNTEREIRQIFLK
jgi:hypothetical protein